jgi:ATP-dependent exoDNAse (exonuclease V) beta subunit
VYRSSAGSGKTFTLVKEFLRLSLHDEKQLLSNFKKILAVTFTNKAAAEMKERVISALDKICHDQEIPPIGNILLEELNLSTTELKRRCAILLNTILHNYSDLAIGTIDSFTHKIVRTFAFDLKLPVNFNLETDVKGFYEKVVAELFSKVGEDAQVTKLLKAYAAEKAEDNASWDPEKGLRKFAELLEKEDAPAFLKLIENFGDRDFEAVRKESREFISNYYNFIATKGKEAINLCEKNGVKKEDFFNKGSGTYSFFEKGAEGNLTSKNLEGKYLQNGINDKKWFKQPHQLDAELTLIASAIKDRFEKENSACVLHELILKQMHLVMLIKKLEELSQNLKNEEHVVFISEFNKKIFELIASEPAPYIFERLGERYRHFLLDEFQDTSALQWQNILPLLDNSLASGWYNMIVGDGKQSIYRWRNANVKQFAGLPHIENKSKSQNIAERAESLARNYEPKELKENRRSTETIVQFNNHLFSELSKELLKGDLKNIYDQTSQIPFSRETGYITFHTGKCSKEEVDLKNNTATLEHIQSALRSGFSYSDICIISRKKTPGKKISAFLTSRSIPVVSSESLLLTSSIEVNTLVHFLTYLSDPDELISGAAVLNYLSHSGQIKAETLAVALESFNKSKDLFTVLNELGFEMNRDEFLLRNLFDNCTHLVNVLSLNKSNPVYIRFFLDEVNEFLVSKNSGLGQFLEWWDKKKYNSSVVISESSNAVKVMTIHKSKGLEFPVVIIPYCNWEQYTEEDAWIKLQGQPTKLPVSIMPLNNKLAEAGLKQELEQEKEEQFLDNLNLLYVAFTRASERLHVITHKNVKYNDKTVDEWLNDHLKKNFSDTEGIFKIGEEKTALQKKSSGHPALSLPSIAFNIDNKIVHVKSSSLEYSQKSEEAIKLGIAMHEILSQIISADDIPAAIQNSLQKGLIEEGKEKQVSEKINTLISSPLLKKYFSKEVRTKIESELITKNAEILRPDRIAFLKEETVIIDFKTGIKNDRKYEEKMFQYQDALADMGHQNIRKILAYIDSNEISEL